MQIRVGSSGNFAKYNKCKQITSWDKPGYTVWDQFMENFKSQTKKYRMQFTGHEEPLNIFKHTKGMRKSALNNPLAQERWEGTLQY